MTTIVEEPKLQEGNEPKPVVLSTEPKPQEGNEPKPVVLSTEPKPQEGNEPKPQEANESKPQGLFDENAGNGDDVSYDEVKFKDESRINDDTKKDFINLCKEVKISPENAQKIVDLQTKLNVDYANRQEAQRVKAINDWKVEVKKNYGIDYAAKLACGKKALETYGTTELIEILGDKGTGLGNHPVVVDFFVKIGEKLQNDPFVKPKSGPSVSLDNRTTQQKAKAMYGDM